MMKSVNRRIAGRGILCLFIIVFLSSGCASTKLTRDAGRVAALKEVAVAADAAMIHEKTLGYPTLSIAENEEIAKALSAKAAALLKAKGYSIAGEPAYSVGVSQTEAKTLKIVNGVGGEIPEYPPYLAGPPGGPSRQALAKLFWQADREAVRAADNPYGERPVLILNGGGQFISGGAVAGNCCLIGLSVAAGAGGGNSSSGSSDFGTDGLYLTLRLFDAAEGKMIWKDEYRGMGNPDKGNFVRQLEKMIEKLPAAGSGQGGQSR